MKYRLLLAAAGATLFMSACGSVPSGDSSCRPPAYCGSQVNYNGRGQA